MWRIVYDFIKTMFTRSGVLNVLYSQNNIQLMTKQYQQYYNQKLSNIEIQITIYWKCIHSYIKNTSKTSLMIRIQDDFFSLFAQIIWKLGLLNHPAY